MPKRHEEVENGRGEFHRIKVHIEKEYPGTTVTGNGGVFVDKNKARERYRAQEYVMKNIKSAIRAIKKEGIKDLPEHLTRCLQNQKGIYRPDSDLNWEITWPS